MIGSLTLPAIALLAAISGLPGIPGLKGLPMPASKEYARAKADLERILAGTWKEDIVVARAAVQLASSQVMPRTCSGRPS